MAVKVENTNTQELENLDWTIGCQPVKRGKYQITIETTGNGKPELKVKVDSWDLKVWRNFQKHASATKSIVGFRPYNPVPFKNGAYADAEIKEIKDEIKALENKLTEFKGGAK